MALGAVLAAALTDHSARSKGLFINGLDVIAEPAVPARYAVPIETVLIEEMGYDGVSSMEFTVECSTALPISVPDGSEVRFEDFTASNTLFRGWVDHVDYENMDGDVGTRFVVRCTGAEAALDWAILPNDVTIPAATAPENAVLTLTGQAVGPVMASLRAFASSTGLSTDAGPIVNGLAATANAVTVTAGTTLREGIRQIIGQVPLVAVTTDTGLHSSVDFLFGLRFYSRSTMAAAGNITIDDDPPLTILQAEDLKYGIDAAQYRAVLVKGTAVTAVVSDGSGKSGAIAVLNDSTITTAAAATTAGTAYLAQYIPVARGSFGLSAISNTLFSPALNMHVYRMSATITDARVGLVSELFDVNTVAKTFNPGNTENWTVSFGGDTPSVTALTRQLTRTTLS